MKPPVCKACGKAEYSHICRGSTASKPEPEAPKRGGFGARKPSAPAVSAAVAETPKMPEGRPKRSRPARSRETGPGLPATADPQGVQIPPSGAKRKPKAKPLVIIESRLHEADLAGVIVDRDAVVDVPRRFGMATLLPAGLRTAADLLNMAHSGPERVTNDGEIIGDGVALTSVRHPKGKSVVGRKRKPKLSEDALETVEAPASLAEKIEESVVRRRAPKGTFDRNAWAREHMRRKRAEAKKRGDK